MGELRCLACHSLKDAPHPLERTAPDLADVGAGWRRSSYESFIASPSASHFSTTMPDLLAAEPADQRDKIAEAITHFLVAQSPRKFQHDNRQRARGRPRARPCFTRSDASPVTRPRDDSGKEIDRDGVVELGHIPAKYSLVSLTDFLFQPAARPAVGPDAGHEVDAGRGQGDRQLPARQSRHEGQAASSRRTSWSHLARSTFNG